MAYTYSNKLREDANVLVHNDRFRFVAFYDAQGTVTSGQNGGGGTLLAYQAIPTITAGTGSSQDGNSNLAATLTIANVPASGTCAEVRLCDADPTGAHEIVGWDTGTNVLGTNDAITAGQSFEMPSNVFEVQQGTPS